MPAPLPVLLAEVLPARAPHAHNPVVTAGHAFQPLYGSGAPCQVHGICLPSVQATVSPRAEMTTSHSHPAQATSTTSSTSQSRCAATVHIARAYAACVGCLRSCTDCVVATWSLLSVCVASRERSTLPTAERLCSCCRVAMLLPDRAPLGRFPTYACVGCLAGRLGGHSTPHRALYFTGDLSGTIVPSRI